MPDFQSLMLPYLNLLKDEREHKVNEIIDNLAQILKLSDAERWQRSENSSNIILNNRCGWTKTHLMHAGLIEAPARGTAKITKSGLHLLAQKPEKIDMKLLSQFPDYRKFRKPETESEPGKTELKEMSTNLTPLEYLEKGYQELNNALADNLLIQVKSASPGFFEKLVVDLLRKMGYGKITDKNAGKVVGKSGDGGIDGIIREDKLGLDLVHIQAKRWTDSVVGSKEIQSFAGSLTSRKTNKGVFITTSTFSSEAKKFAKDCEKNIVLIDGGHLVRLMIEHSVGVTEETIYSIKRLDYDYFEEG